MIKRYYIIFGFFLLTCQSNPQNRVKQLLADNNPEHLLENKNFLLYYLKKYSHFIQGQNNLYPYHFVLKKQAYHSLRFLIQNHIPLNDFFSYPQSIDHSIYQDIPNLTVWKILLPVIPQEWLQYNFLDPLGYHFLSYFIDKPQLLLYFLKQESQWKNIPLNNLGETISHLVISHHLNSIFTFILQNNLVSLQQNRMKQTPIDYAIIEGNTKMVKLLMSYTTPDRYDIPMMYHSFAKSQNPSQALLSLLGKNSSFIRSKNTLGFTPSQLAQILNNKKAYYLLKHLEQEFYDN